eukprot:TRINITY_DN10126_c0_g1_i2.p1 TRINITY_DN10126_c0_g1~~TRINITY_DN10126_c0_g1_i2.p1  ORF type:complete len:205 (+),score=32.26 TRINITY_DN10126_c0_g1_i2:76-690(+)
MTSQRACVHSFKLIETEGGNKVQATPLNRTSNSGDENDGPSHAVLTIDSLPSMSSEGGSSYSKGSLPPMTFHVKSEDKLAAILQAEGLRLSSTTLESLPESGCLDSYLHRQMYLSNDSLPEVGKMDEGDPSPNLDLEMDNDVPLQIPECSPLQNDASRVSSIKEGSLELPEAAHVHHKLPLTSDSPPPLTSEVEDVKDQNERLN